jgi:hypothetical protein
MLRLSALAALSFVALTASPGFADTTLFGPQKYKQLGPGPTPPLAVTTSTFNVGDPSGVYTLRAVRGGAVSATIRLNGQTAVQPADLMAPLPATLNRQVTLAAGVNELVVELGGSYGTSVTISIFEDTTPPTITATGAPVANASGWNKNNVTVKFKCVDSGSGIETCPAQVVVSTEGSVLQG